MTFAVDWTLKHNYLSIDVSLLIFMCSRISRTVRVLYAENIVVVFLSFFAVLLHPFLDRKKRRKKGEKEEKKIMSC